MIPNQIKIGGQVYAVNVVDNCNAENRNCDGQIIYSKDTIEIRSDMKGDYLKYVLLHEVFHGIYEHCGFEQNENEVDRLTRALHMVMKDNPQLIDFIKEGE
jgi:hypothetical protein